MATLGRRGSSLPAGGGRASFATRRRAVAPAMSLNRAALGGARVQAGTIDVALSPMFITDKRLAAIDMVPWTDAGTCYLIRKSETRFKTTQDFNQAGIRITGFVGTGTTQQIQKAYPNAQMVLRQQ